MISSSDEEVLKTLSHFTIQKCSTEKHSKCVFKSTSLVNVSECCHIFLLIHQRELSDVETWKMLVMKKYFETIHHKMLQMSGG